MSDTRQSNALLISALVVLVGGLGIGWYTSTLESPRPEAPHEAPEHHEHATGAFRARLWEDPFFAVSRFKRQEARFPKNAQEGDADESTRHDVDSFLNELADEAETCASGIHVMMVMVRHDPSVEAHELALRCRRAVLDGLKTSGYIPTAPNHLNYVEIPWKDKLDRPQTDHNFSPLRVPYEWFRRDELRSLKDACDGTAKDWQSHERVLLLWLKDHAFRPRPLIRLAQLADMLQRDDQGCSQPQQIGSIHVIGPDNSDTLVAMVRDAGRLNVDDIASWFQTWPPLDAFGKALSCVMNSFELPAQESTRISESWLKREILCTLSGILRNGQRLIAQNYEDWPRLDSQQGCKKRLSLHEVMCRLKEIKIYSHRSTAHPQLLLEEAKADQSSSIKEGLDDKLLVDDVLDELVCDFVRTVADDRRLAEELLRELERRDIRLFFQDKETAEDQAPIALISEWDTSYGRTFLFTFQAALEYERSQRLNKDSPEQCDNRRRDNQYACIFKKLYEGESGEGFENVVPIRHYTYLRGIDGKSPFARDAKTEEPAEQRAGSDRKQPPSSILVEQPERPIGQAQSDYARRIAAKLADDYYPSAIGIVGTDVYDKILLLQALRDELGNDVIFFTTDLDARLYFHKYFKATRNLVVASHFGLSLRGNFRRDPEIPQSFRRTARFRDTYQTALFLATRLSLGLPEDADKLEKGFVEDDEIREYLDEPRLYEIGREEAVDISPEFRVPLELSNIEDAATTELHLVADKLTGSESLPKQGCLTEDANFDLVVDGRYTLNVTVAASDTKCNCSRDCLLQDIRAAIDCAFRKLKRDGEVSQDERLEVQVELVDGSLWLRGDRYVHNEVREGLNAVTGKDWMIWLAYVAAVLSVMGIGYLLYDSFYGVSWWKATAQERALYWGVGAAAVLFGFALLAYFQWFYTERPFDEPFSLTSGASVWPSILLRGLAVFLGLWFMINIRKKVRISNKELGQRFRIRAFPSDAAWQRSWQKAAERVGDGEWPPRPNGDFLKQAGAWLEWVAKSGSYYLCRLWGAIVEYWRCTRIPFFRESQDNDFQDLWEDYQHLGRFWKSFWRSFPLTTLYMFSFQCLVFPLLGAPNFPVRGEFSECLTRSVSFLSVALMVLLVFFILDVTLLCIWFINRVRKWMKEAEPFSLVDEDRRFWLPDRLGQSDEVTKINDEYALMRLIGERTRTVGSLILYPAVLVLIIIVSRNRWFDDWNFPVSLTISFALLGTVLLVSAWLLRRNSKKAKSEALESLEHAKVFAQTQEEHSDKVARIESSIERIRALRVGAFCSFAENPVLHSLLIPSGGYGLIWSLLQLLQKT